MALYDNLPGIELTIQDRGLILPAEAAPTATVLIIAPTTNTPSTGTYSAEEYNPVRITGQADFDSKGMGVYNIDNPMARLWKQAYDAGCRDIRVIKLKGADAQERYGHLHDIFYVLEENIDADIVLVGGIYADDTITNVVTFSYERADFAIPVVTSNALYTNYEKEAAGTGDGLVKEFTLDHFPVLKETVEVVFMEGSTPTAVQGSAYTVDEMTGKITFTTAPAADVDVEVTYKAYAYNFAAQLAGFCETVSTKNQQLIGIMALKPAIDNNVATIKAYVDGQKQQQYSKFLQIVGGATLWFSLGSSLYEDTFVGAYAGLISILPSQSSPMFKAIPGALFTSYNLSPTQITGLINKHIVCPRVRNGRIIIADAITTADDLSDFVRLSTLRIVNDVTQYIREISEPYIGEPNTTPRRNSLETAIRSGLTTMIQRGALNDFRFYIKSSIADQIDGTMRIMLDIVPVFETRRILIAVAVKPML